MAGESKQPVDGEVENGLNEEESESNYACCVKKPCKVTVCRNCGKVFHISCAKRILGSEVKGTLTECCDVEQKVEEANQPCEKWQEKAEIEKLNVEVDLLKRLVKEVFEKNEILMQNNDLLRYKIDSLVKNNAEEKSRNQDKDKGIGATQAEGQRGQRDVSRSSAQENGNRVSVQQRRNREMADKVADVDTNDGQRPMSNHRPQVKNGEQIHQRDHGGHEQPVNSTSEQHGNRQASRSWVQRYRDHGPKSSEKSEPDVNDVTNKDKNEWQEVRSNRSRFRDSRQKGENSFTKNNPNPHRHHGQEKVVGEAGGQAENGFTGVERKVWLYVDKVSKHVTAEDVAEYVRKRPGFEGEDVRVKNVSKESNVGNSFVVVAPFKKKAELYDAKFWPSNIVVRRFNFRRYHDENDSHFLVL